MGLVLRMGRGPGPVMDGRFEIVGEAGTGKEAVKVARELQPDAIILDLMMPEKTGIEAIPEIIRSAPETKIMVLSAYDERRRMKAIHAGAHNYEFKAKTSSEGSPRAW